VDRIWLDEVHGLRISVRGHEGRWPVSTIKFSQTSYPPMNGNQTSPAASG
jgi:hypothetical protein